MQHMNTRNFWALGLLALAAVGCGEDDKKDGDAAPGGDDCASTLSYEKTAAPFIQKYCVSCHGAGLTGAARMAAPVGHDYGTLALLEEKGHITAERVSATGAASMPPDRTGIDQPTDQEREDFLEWMDCSGTSELGEDHAH
jgi:uncharacterized membrane protein